MNEKRNFGLSGKAVLVLSVLACLLVFGASVAGAVFLSISTADDGEKDVNEYVIAVDDSITVYLGDAFKFVKEEMMCKIISYKGNVFGVEPPIFVELAVTETDPGFAGNTATNTLKPATLETGAVIKVPLFINVGDVLKIDTRTGEYLSRA